MLAAVDKGGFRKMYCSNCGKSISRRYPRYKNKGFSGCKRPACKERVDALAKGGTERLALTPPLVMPLILLDDSRSITAAGTVFYRQAPTLDELERLAA